jgi:DUF4097 and DUF4098 domain-containing protein YvlB
MAEGTSYRRGSGFGALLLIAIGALFLYANLNPEFSAWPFIARYWPVLIIFWGLSKLTDYLVLRGTPQAAAAARITGGDIVGLVFLILCGTAFSAAVERGWRHGPITIGDEELGCLFGNEFEFTDELTQEISPASTLTVANLRGDLTVETESGNELHLLAHKTVCAASEEEAQRMAARFVPVLEEDEDGFDFHWDAPSGGSGLTDLRLEVQAPKDINLQLKGRRGDVRLGDVQGNVEIQWERGDASLDEITGDVRLKIRRGSVQVADVTGSVEVEGRGGEVLIRDIEGPASIEGEFYGPLQFANIAGAARFTSRRTNFNAARIDGEMTVDSGDFTLRGVQGDMTLRTRDKEIEVEEVAGEIRIENRNGRIQIRALQPLRGPIAVENERGGIELELPAGSSFTLSATSRKGRVDTNFDGLQEEEQSGGTTTLTGSPGGGGPAIRLTTSYGTISVRRTG